MKSFRDAFRGILTALGQERHMRFHLCMGYFVVWAGFVTRLSPGEWAAILLCLGLVASLELVNTALERLCGQVTREYSPLIRTAKDCAAGAVLCSAIASALVGCVVFFSQGRPALAMDYFLSHKAAWALFLPLPAMIYYVFKRSVHK